MGSSVSSSHSNSKCGNTSEHTSQKVVMQQSVTQKVIPTNGTQALPSSYTPQKPLKGILKNKCVVQQKVEIPVKVVELYVLRGNEWSVSRVREVSENLIIWLQFKSHEDFHFRTRLTSGKRNSSQTRLWSGFTRNPLTTRRSSTFSLFDASSPSSSQTRMTFLQNPTLL